MNYIKSLIIVASLGLISACGGNASKQINNESPKNISEKVDYRRSQLEAAISPYNLVVSLDHHRIAAEVGVYTPPAIATIFSNTDTDIALIQKAELVALDLPFKILIYAEPDTMDAKITCTCAGFIEKRHQLNPNLLEDYGNSMDKILSSFPEEMVSKTDVSTVEKGFGIVNIKSDFDHATTIAKLREIIMSQGDTKWFADVDYQKEASTLNVAIRPTTLLLFGGPAPGGKAMITSPKIGLDAFARNYWSTKRRTVKFG
jgi:uncharacterized protein (DUF302 family)